MKSFIESIEISIKTQNWYSALIVSLTLPDIAGKIETPNEGSGNRYAIWFDKYVGNEYKTFFKSENTEHIFLSGNDCYALRCSYLHEGKSDITHQRARKVLEDFEFVVPPEGSVIHCNLLDNKLQLQVDIFCNDIINGIKTWIGTISEDQTKLSALDNLLKINQLK